MDLADAMPLLLTVLAAGLTRVALPRGLALIEQAGFVRPNFRGEMVPSAAGTIIAYVYGTVLIVWQALSPSVVLRTLTSVTVAMAFVGFVDDVLGDKSTQGMRGHVRALLRGNLSTGGVKAIFGVVVSFGAADAVTDGVYNLVLGTLVIALTANAINLLDLRPGRAVKGTVLAAACLYSASMAAHVWVYTLPLLAVLVVYAPYDLQARTMLGDTGANAVGAILGVAAVAALSPVGLTLFAALLIVLHLLAEQGSISRTIERVPVLKLLDDWGRD